MQHPRVSVIVPVYNVEAYAEECLNSLIVQDLEGIEIIVVDDGSSDGTAAIVRRYEAAHPNLHVISQENQGLSAARNAGMAIARGDYLGFVDGDDWVHSAMYAEMHGKAIATGADLIITNGYLYNDQSKGLRPIQDSWLWDRFKVRDCSAALDPRAWPELFMLDTSACKRLYRRAFLEQLGFRFMPGKIFEDVATHYHLLLNSRAVALLDRRFYYYRTDRPGRITARRNRDLFHFFDMMEAVIADLRTHDARPNVWACFIWFQNWVLRWLGEQVDSAHAGSFTVRSRDIARLFDAAGVEFFFENFSGDQAATDFVRGQLGQTAEAQATETAR